MLSSRTDAANLIEIDNILVEYGRVEIWLVMNALLCVWYFNPRIFTPGQDLAKAEDSGFKRRPLSGGCSDEEIGTLHSNNKF